LLAPGRPQKVDQLLRPSRVRSRWKLQPAAFCVRLPDLIESPAMNWLTVVEAIGIFGVGSGLLAWLIRSLVKQALDRDLKVFEHGLRAAHEIQMEEVRNRLTIGATSHMADVVFDKHVEFCEQYTAAVNETVAFLFRRGLNRDVLQNASNLKDIRLRWNVWLTPDVETQLEKFEAALRKIGANVYLLEALRADEERGDAVKEAYGTFAAVVGWEDWQGQPVTRDLAAEKIIEGLRKVLGITELTRLRSELVGRALAKPKPAGPAQG